MKEEMFNYIVSAMRTRADLDRLASEHRTISYGTLFSIYSSMVRAKGRPSLNVGSVRSDIVGYLEDNLYDCDTSVALRLSAEYGVLPCQLMRAMLEEVLAKYRLDITHKRPPYGEFWGVYVLEQLDHLALNKSTTKLKALVSKLMVSPELMVDWDAIGLLPDQSYDMNPLLQRLYHEVNVGIYSDDVYSPLCNLGRSYAGNYHELYLRDRLKAMAISFHCESELRSLSLAKTPDIILDIPIGINGHIVKWIESKALFGDPVSHGKYLDEQYFPYVNRFGPGLVIYWMDFVAELDCLRHQGILLMVSTGKHW